MSNRLLRLALALLLMVGVAPAAFSKTAIVDTASSGASEPPPLPVSGASLDVGLLVPPAIPRMSPGLALDTFFRRSQEQNLRLLSYSDETVMRAELPDYKQSGEYELKRQYSAPNTLKFTPLRYTGNGFVKTNVLVRLLQSEVDHVEKGLGADTALTEANYKFSHKAVESVDGRLLYVFHVKPRKKRVGLFKGKIYVDAYTGDLVRAEGEMVKSPSLFIRKLSFVQDYANIGGVVLPTHLHSAAKVRIIGRTVVDIFHRDYQARTTGQPAATPVATGAVRPGVSGASGSTN